MTTITQDANTTFRDYTTTTGSAPWPPVKGDIRALFAKVDTAIAAAATTGGTGTGGDVSITGGGLGFNFATLTEARAATLDAGVSWFRTAGFSTAGDKGDGLYVKLSSDPAWATLEPVTGGAITGRNAGVPTTNAGAYFWMLVPEWGMIKPTQFGARVGHDWNDSSLDQWPFFEDSVWFIVNQGYEAGLTMFIPSSWYYLTKPLTCTAGHFNIRGSGESRDGSVLWWPHTSQGVLVGNSQAGWITIDLEGGPYNGNFAGQFLGDTRYNMGDATNRVYVCTIAGIPGGWNSTTGNWASPPSGTGTDIIDGTVHWSYQRQLTRIEKLAISNGHGGGGNFEHLELYCGTTWISPPARNKNSGFVARNRCVVRDIFSASWPGCGIAFVSDGDLTFRGGSNCNGWRADHIVCYWNGMDGLHIGNSNSNAGTLIDGDFSANGRWAIANWCFLDNSYTSVQVAYDGNPDAGAPSQYPHGVSYNGRWYIARVPIYGLEGPTQVDDISGNQIFPAYQSPAPDTSSYWIYIGGDGTWGASNQYPAWSSSGKYEAGGGFSSNNFNDRSVITKLYVEGGTFASQFMPLNLQLGGLTQWSYGGTAFNDRKWNQTISNYANGVNPTTGVTKGIQFNFGSGTGGGLAVNSYPKGIFGVNEYEGTQFALEGNDSSRFDQTDWVFTTASGSSKYTILRLCTLNTSQTWGTGTHQSLSVHVPRLVIGGGPTDGRLMQMGTAPPTSEEHARGEVMWNMNASVGQPKGWQCTATGTPGTWVSMGNL